MKKMNQIHYQNLYVVVVVVVVFNVNQEEKNSGTNTYYFFFKHKKAAEKNLNRVSFKGNGIKCINLKCSSRLNCYVYFYLINTVILGMIE